MGYGRAAVRAMEGGGSGMNARVQRVSRANLRSITRGAQAASLETLNPVLCHGLRERVCELWGCSAGGVEQVQYDGIAAELTRL